MRIYFTLMAGGVLCYLLSVGNDINAQQCAVVETVVITCAILAAAWRDK